MPYEGEHLFGTSFEKENLEIVEGGSGENTLLDQKKRLVLPHVDLLCWNCEMFISSSQASSSNSKSEACQKMLTLSQLGLAPSLLPNEGTFPLTIVGGCLLDFWAFCSNGISDIWVQSVWVCLLPLKNGQNLRLLFSSSSLWVTTSVQNDGRFQGFYSNLLSCQGKRKHFFHSESTKLSTCSSKLLSLVGNSLTPSWVPSGLCGNQGLCAHYHVSSAVTLSAFCCSCCPSLWPVHHTPGVH